MLNGTTPEIQHRKWGPNAEFLFEKNGPAGSNPKEENWKNTVVQM